MCACVNVRVFECRKGYVAQGLFGRRGGGAHTVVDGESQLSRNVPNGRWDYASCHQYVANCRPRRGSFHEHIAIIAMRYGGYQVTQRICVVGFPDKIP